MYKSWDSKAFPSTLYITMSCLKLEISNYISGIIDVATVLAKQRDSLG